MNKRIHRSVPDVPVAVPGQSQLEVLGGCKNKCVCIRHVRCILNYSSEEITMKAGNEKIAVRGQQLFCRMYSCGTIHIAGSVQSICFLGGHKG